MRPKIGFLPSNFSSELLAFSIAYFHESTLLDSDHWFLSNNGNVLTLNAVLNSKAVNLSFDFLSDSFRYRIKHGGGSKEALAKAIGAKKGCDLSVVDATAGMGRESFILAMLDCQVTALERDPVIFCLLKDAIDRLYESPLCELEPQQLTCHFSTSIDYLSSLKSEERPDVIYLDPMFPHRDKSASVKKEMQIFQKLVEGDHDSDELFDAAIAKAKKRVVVKRPNSAPFLSSKKPSYQIKGKKHRFDIYI